jgi:succinylglutamate desuccinylase
MNAAYFHLLEQIDEVRETLKIQGRISESYDFGFLVSEPTFDSSSAIDLLLLTVVHGNEAGSLVPVLRLLREFAAGKKIDGRLAILICNHEAAVQNVRFVEKDLNRCFGIGDNQSLEGRIAQQIEPLILRSKYLLDLHQTNYETKSDFFIFPETTKNIAFASQICLETPIIVHGLDFSKDGYTSDTFATMNGVTSLTYEMGQIGKAAEQAEKTVTIIERAFYLSRHGLQGSSARANILQFSQIVTASSQKRLIPNLINMSRVISGDVLGHDDVHGPIVAAHDGYVLFPKYGIQAETSSELCHVVKSL